MSVHWPIIRRSLRSPLRRLIVDDRRTYRGLELVVGALHVSDAIARVCRTDHIGLLLPSSGAFPFAALGGWILGKTIVPLNFLLKPEELRYVVRDSAVDTIVTIQPMLDFLGGAPPVEHLIRLEDVPFRGAPEPRWPVPVVSDQLAVILYTSGTSGRPKGVMLTHGNLSANVRQLVEWAAFTDRDVLLGVLPQFHSFGLTVLTILPLTLGCRVIYAARFVPQQVIRLFREHRPTAFIGIPSMYGALLTLKNAKPEDFASLRFAVSGGEPLPDAIAQGFRDRFGVTINEGYGLTETSPVTHWCRPHEFRPHTVGKPIPGVRQRIVDLDTGADLPPGRDGEILLSGPNVMKGYYRLPDETAAAFDDRGYFRTGDIGRVDEEGFLSITGRAKEMLIVGGENVFPREIEEVLARHPSVNACGVIGVQDPIRGETPMAFVELVEGHEFSEQAIIRHCRDRLAAYKVPRAVRLVHELPRSPTGKILRRDLQKLL